MFWSDQRTWDFFVRATFVVHREDMDHSFQLNHFQYKPNDATNKKSVMVGKLVGKLFAKLVGPIDPVAGKSRVRNRQT